MKRKMMLIITDMDDNDLIVNMYHLIARDDGKTKGESPRDVVLRLLVDIAVRLGIDLLPEPKVEEGKKRKKS